MYKDFLLAVLLVGCSGVEPTVCNPSGELPLKDFNAICSSSILCTTGDISEYARHLCFCDTLCICFHSKFQLSDSCKDVSSIQCKRNNMMMFFGRNFCTFPKSEREFIMNNIRLQSGNQPKEEKHE